MKYIAIFDVPDDNVIYQGRPAFIFSHGKDSLEVITVTIAEDVKSQEDIIKVIKGGLYDN